MSKPNTRVPTDAIAPFVRKYLDEYFTYEIRRDDDPDDPSRWCWEPAPSPAQILADQVGRGVDWIYRIVRPERRWKTLSFDDADALLCACNMPWAWQTEALRDIYYSVDLKTLDKALPPRRRRKPKPDRTKRATETHCANGHPWTPESTRYRNDRLYPNSRIRICKVCRSAQAKKSYAEKRTKELAARARRERKRAWREARDGRR